MLAASSGTLELTTILVEAGADVNFRDKVRNSSQLVQQRKTILAPVQVWTSSNRSTPLVRSQDFAPVGFTTVNSGGTQRVTSTLLLKEIRYFYAMEESIRPLNAKDRSDHVLLSCQSKSVNFCVLHSLIKQAMLVFSGWVNCAHVCLSEGTHGRCEEATFSTKL